MRVSGYFQLIRDEFTVDVCAAAIRAVLLLVWVLKFAGRRNTAVFPIQRSNSGIGADSAVGGRQDVEVCHISITQDSTVVNDGYT